MRSNQLAAMGAFVLVGWCASAGMAAADPTPAPPPGPKTSIDSNGTYQVGTDIAPGTYSSAGPIENGACYWRRVSGDTVVDNAMTKQPQVVQIDATDTSFKTSDCQPWQKIDDCLPGCGPPTPAAGDVLGQLGRLLLRPPSGPLPAEGGG
jgi:hypothetical protein